MLPVKFTIACDVDDVIADMVPVWLDRYNNVYDDNLAIEDITDWKLEKFVKPECASFIYRLFDAQLYNSIYPIPNSKHGIDKIREMGHRVVFVTSPALDEYGVKFQWLVTHKFIDNNKDYIECVDKRLVSADFLIDDNPNNFNGFFGVPILFTKPWNISSSNNFEYVADGWDEVIRLIAEFSQQE